MRKLGLLVMSFSLIALAIGFAVSNPQTPTAEKGSQATSAVEKQGPEATQQRHFRYAIPQWCQALFGAKYDTAGLLKVAKELDCDLDLMPHDQWDKAKEAKVGLSCILPDMGNGPDGKPLAPFAPGFNDPKHTERVHKAIDTALDRASAAGVRYVIVFAGMDTGEARGKQFKRVVDGFTTKKGKESLIQKAERLKVTFVIEMLNTKGDEATWRGHPGFLANNTEELVKNVVRPIRSDRFKLAFDIYHITLMGEDALELVKMYHNDIGYVHVAGVMKQAEGHHPKNRGELTLPGQQVDYATICAKLSEHLPKGTYLLLEYIPTKAGPAEVQRDLAAAIALCESKIGKK